MMNNLVNSYNYAPLLNDLLKLCIKHKVCITKLSYMGCDDKDYIKAGEFAVVDYGVIKFKLGYETL